MKRPPCCGRVGGLTALVLRGVVHMDGRVKRPLYVEVCVRTTVVAVGWVVGRVVGWGRVGGVQRGVRHARRRTGAQARYWSSSSSSGRQRNSIKMTVWSLVGTRYWIDRMPQLFMRIEILLDRARA